MIIKVGEGKDKPHKCSSGFYLRQGVNSQKMSRDEILDFAIGEGKIKFDSQINQKFDFKKDFDEERFNLFLKENNLFTGLKIKNVLISLGLGSQKGKKTFLNNAGVLFFSKNPQKFFLHAYLDCVLFKGRDKSKVIDRKTFRVGLLDQLFSAKKFVKKHLNLSYEFDDFERKEIYEIPLRAIEEALVNALMHRDYFFGGANISLFIYDDRVEIISPGGLPKGLNRKDFGKLSVRRNKIIADVFSKTPYVEQIGSGIKRMKELLKNAGLPFPKFKMNNFFIVIFKKKELVHGGEKGGEKVGEKGGEKVGEKLTKNQELILKYIYKDKHISIIKLSKKVGMATKNIEENIAKLKQKNLLKRIGPAKGGYWEIIE